jgi:Domain of unknown function (DUF4351)
MSKKTSHDHLFKEVLGEFFPEFIESFVPEVLGFLDRDSIEFLPMEIFADLLKGAALSTDVIVKARFLGRDAFFIIHVEHQNRFGPGFDRRVFQYFSLLDRDYGLPIYPIVIFSHRSPRVLGDRSYVVEFSGWEVLRFSYRVVPLNRLAWQNFVGSRNPVAIAFMSKMGVKKKERVAVKLECLKGLAELKLNPAQLLLLSGFVDTYLKLGVEEEGVLMEEIAKMKGKPKEGVMQIVTSWMEKGLEQGRQEGRREQVALLLGQLRWKIGALSDLMEQRVEGLPIERLRDLAMALLEFESEADLRRWLG